MLRSRPPPSNSAGMGAVRVLLADDHPVFREGLQKLLEAEPRRRKHFQTPSPNVANHTGATRLRDAKTVPQALTDLEQRFGLRRVVFVGDRGMVTSDNVDLLRARQQGYVVGLNRRRRE